MVFPAEPNYVGTKSSKFHRHPDNAEFNTAEAKSSQYGGFDY